MLFLKLRQTFTNLIKLESVLAAILIWAAIASPAYAGVNMSLKNNFIARIFDYGAPEKGERSLEQQAVKNETQLPPGTEEYRIVLDPGHGGVSERASQNKGDHWDIKARGFLTNYNFGAACNGECEHAIVLDICSKVLNILQKANTDEGWREFSRMLSEYGVMRPEEYRRIKFNVKMSRADSYESLKYKGDDNVNRHFRLFDSPESFDAKKKPSQKLFPGRMSKINAETPELVLCVHVNSSTNLSMRGPASVIIPGYRVFDFVKTVKDRLGMRSAMTYFWILSWFYYDNMVLGKLSDLINDCDTYFTGKRTATKGSIGKRWQMVKWRYSEDDEYNNLLSYKNPDSYWHRERSAEESMRRDGGPLGFGGDNFYASEEVLKYVRMGLWKEYAASGVKSAGETAAVKTPNEYLGNHGRPFISDWALPQLINAVTAYVELGYLENTEDRNILLNKKDIIARSMAVSTYSLLCGMTPKKLINTRDALIKANPQLAASPVNTDKKTLQPKTPRTDFFEKPKTSILLNKLKSKMKPYAGKKVQAQQARPEPPIYSKEPLEFPLGQKINMTKYSDYFKSVLKQK